MSKFLVRRWKNCLSWKFLLDLAVQSFFYSTDWAKLRCRKSDRCEYWKSVFYVKYWCRTHFPVQYSVLRTYLLLRCHSFNKCIKKWKFLRVFVYFTTIMSFWNIFCPLRFCPRQSWEAASSLSTEILFALFPKKSV